MGIIRWTYETFFWEKPDNTSSGSLAGKWVKKNHEKEVAAFGAKAIVAIGLVAALAKGCSNFIQWAETAPTISDAPTTELQQDVSASEVAKDTSTAQPIAKKIMRQETDNTSPAAAPIEKPSIKFASASASMTSPLTLDSACTNVSNAFNKPFDPNTPVDLTPLVQSMDMCFSRQGNRVSSCDLAKIFSDKLPQNPSAVYYDLVIQDVSKNCAEQFIVKKLEAIF